MSTTENDSSQKLKEQAHSGGNWKNTQLPIDQDNPMNLTNLTNSCEEGDEFDECENVTNSRNVRNLRNLTSKDSLFAVKPNGESAKANARLGSVIPTTVFAPT